MLGYIDTTYFPDRLMPVFPPELAHARRVLGITKDEASPVLHV